MKSDSRKQKWFFLSSFKTQTILTFPSETRTKILGFQPALSPFQDWPLSSHFFREWKRIEKPGKHYVPLTEIKYKHTVSISHRLCSQMLILFSDMWENLLSDTHPGMTGRKQDIYNEVVNRFQSLGPLCL